MSTLRQWLQEQPIVITGRGAVTAAGAGVDKLWAAVAGGKPAADWLPQTAGQGQPRLPGCRAPELPAMPPLARKLDRSARLGMAAALEAWDDARLSGTDLAPERIGVVSASSRGTIGLWGRAYELLAQGKTPPSIIAGTTIAHLSGALSLHLKLRGPMMAVSATCASSAAAMVVAAQQLLTGAADIVLAGGAEAPLEPVVLRGFDTARLLGSHAQPALACRPFDATRNGTVLGEGAGFVVLETLASARRRGAVIYGRLAGWALGAEAVDRAGTDPTGRPLARLMEEALAAAGAAPGAVDYLNLHGTGTVLNDLSEARAVGTVFGAPARQSLASSTKPITGHCMGAGAAVEAIICLEAMRQGLLPPSVNCAQPDPACELALVGPVARRAPCRLALSLSAGFWGAQGVVVLKAPAGGPGLPAAGE